MINSAKNRASSQTQLPEQCRSRILHKATRSTLYSVSPAAQGLGFTG